MRSNQNKALKWKKSYPKMGTKPHHELDIIKDIRTFCNANNLLGEFLKISFFVTVAGDCREKAKKI